MSKGLDSPKRAGDNVQDFTNAMSKRKLKVYRDIKQLTAEENYQLGIQAKYVRSAQECDEQNLSSAQIKANSMSGQTYGSVMSRILWKAWLAWIAFKKCL